MSDRGSKRGKAFGLTTYP